jgi:hypothetical protein
VKATVSFFSSLLDRDKWTQGIIHFGNNILLAIGCLWLSAMFVQILRVQVGRRTDCITTDDREDDDPSHPKEGLPLHAPWIENSHYCGHGMMVCLGPMSGYGRHR